MFGYVVIVHIYFKTKLIPILLQGLERPAKTKLMPAKLRAVLATLGFSENVIHSVSLHRIWLRTVLACAESDSVQR